MKNNKPSMIYPEKYPDKTVKKIIEDAKKAQCVLMDMEIILVEGIEAGKTEKILSHVG